jgi:hypothetical protein
MSYKNFLLNFKLNTGSLFASAYKTKITLYHFLFPTKLSLHEIFFNIVKCSGIIEDEFLCMFQKRESFISFTRVGVQWFLLLKVYCNNNEKESTIV